MIKVVSFDQVGDMQTVLASQVLFDSNSDWCQVYRGKELVTELRVSDLFTISMKDEPVKTKQEATAQSG